MSKKQESVVNDILEQIKLLNIVNKLKILNILEVEAAIWLEREDQE